MSALPSNKQIAGLLFVAYLACNTAPASAVIVLNGKAAHQTWVVTNLQCGSMANMDAATRAAVMARKSRAWRDAGASGRLDWCPQVVGLRHDRNTWRESSGPRISAGEHASRARGYRLGDQE